MIEPAEFAKGDTDGIGTGAAELTPRLPISDEPSGMPGGGTPPAAVDDGLDDAVTLVEPEPHMPDIPDVSTVPDSPDVGETAGIMPGVAAVSPAIAPVAGIDDPGAIPPPSKLADDPNIWVGAVPTVEQTVPVLGIAIVPVAGATTGLTPGVESSVAPSGMPVGPTGAPMVLPNGDVAPTVGVGDAMPVTCAKAALPMSSVGRITAASAILINMTLPFLP